MFHASRRELFRYLHIAVGLRWKLTDFILFSEPALAPVICSHMMMPFSLIPIYTALLPKKFADVRCVLHRKETICFIVMFGDDIEL